MKVLVIGDGIIDEYKFGTVNRQSPEDKKVPILDLELTEYRLGGVYNVAANIKSLNSRLDVDVSTCIMTDVVDRMLKDRKIESRLTPFDFFNWQFFPNTEIELVKTRFFDQDKIQILRLDNKKRFDNGIISGYESYFKEEFTGFQQFNAVVVSDYNKGTVTNSMLEILHMCDKPLFIDTKKKDFSIWPNNENTFFKINFSEWSDARNIESLKNLVVTRGKLHVLYYKNNNIIGRFDVSNIDKIDVTGAGDVFLSGMVVRYLETNGDVFDAIKFATTVADKSVMKFGTCEINREEL